MHTPKNEAGTGDIFQQAESIAHVAFSSDVRSVRTGVFSICDVDIPFVIADGEVYLQATLPEFFDAVSAALVDLLRNLEARISEARRATLAHADIFPEVHLQGVVGEDMV